MAAGGLAEFRARDVDRPGIPADGFFIAIDRDGEVVGYACLRVLAGRPGVATHDMTAVRRSARGRGVAGALKRATVAWAIGAGLTALETANDVANAPMRALNDRLGYEPLPDWIIFRGPSAWP
jgi:GNAT superfamily N-acetyltransferase